MMGGQVQDDKDFNALVDCILNCVITCLYIKNKFEKTNENNGKKKFLGNLEVRVPLLYVNLFLRDKCNSKYLYIEL
jgi:hypothetical protein